MTESQIILAKEFAWTLYCLFETNNLKRNLPDIDRNDKKEAQKLQRMINDQDKDNIGLQ